MINLIHKEAKRKMKENIKKFKKEIKTIHTNYISENLLDNVFIEAYGTKVPISQISNITKENQQTLIISVFDIKLISKIKKSIENLNFDLNYSSNKNKIRVYPPSLTQERREKLIKIIRNYAEKRKILIRNIRRDLKKNIKNLIKNKKLTKDEEFKNENIIQNLTDNSIKKIKEISKKKEEELMKF